jgi:hypothetical protein
VEDKLTIALALIATLAMGIIGVLYVRKMFK